MTRTHQQVVEEQRDALIRAQEQLQSAVDTARQWSDHGESKRLEFERQRAKTKSARDTAMAEYTAAMAVIDDKLSKEMAAYRKAREAERERESQFWKSFAEISQENRDEVATALKEWEPRLRLY